MMKKMKMVAALATLFALCGCAKDGDADQSVVTGPDDVVLIGSWHREGYNDWVNITDVTSRFQWIRYTNIAGERAIPVKHVAYESLPEGVRETARQMAMSANTAVVRCSRNGETLYHLQNYFIGPNGGLFHASGEQYSLSLGDLSQVFRESTGMECVLLLHPELVKSTSQMAGNGLAGVWQSDWRHLLHAGDTPNDVPLYQNLDFSMREISVFRPDGTGYLRTVKTYSGGETESSVDEFTYTITDYKRWAFQFEGGQMYVYQCCFQRGDTIEYTAVSDIGADHFVRQKYIITYPWFRLQEDPYSAQTVTVLPPKYGTPAKDPSQLLTGKWTGSFVNVRADLLSWGEYTFVFRADGTGYALLDGRFVESFAYTVSYTGGEAQLTLYAYDKGFFVSDGFEIQGDGLNPQVSPTGISRRAVIRADGDHMEIEGFSSLDADGVATNIVFTRVQ